MPGTDGLYFVGPFCPRITFYSQQVRALHLAHALHAEGVIQPNQTVAVVGAGAAGITLAVALALLNYHVTLYDRAGDILRLQSASTRLLHPHIYEWPRLGSLDERAGLPFLDWPAGNGKDVVLDLRTQFAVLKAPLPNLILKTGHDLKSTAQASGEWKLTFKTAGGDESRVVDHVVLTMGFGDERPCGTIAPDDYWAPSAVGTPATEASAVTAVSYVVSGNGDGALTVALSLLIQDFEHVSFTHTFLDYFSRDQLRQAADAAFAGKTFEEDAEQDLRKHVLPTLIQYGAIDKLRQKLRTDRSLTLNTNGPQFAAGKASQLNQCMLLALLEAAAAESVKIVRSTGFVSGCTPTAEGIVLIGTTIAGHADNKAYKHAILRHGPDQVKRYEATGPLIADYRDYVLGLLAAHPERATPPLLHDATYDLFLDKRIERLAAGGAKAQQKAAASQERRVIEIATDPAAHVLVERGCICIIDIAEQCERLPERCTIDVHVAPNQIPDADDLVRLARCSGGKIELRAGDSVLALWDALLPGIASAPEPVSARAVREYLPAQLTHHIDACLVRRLDLKLQEAITNGGAAPLGDISPEILNHVASTWAAWRVALAASPELQYDFLRWLANVDQQPAQPWNGETGDAISDMTNALILIAAAHAGEPLVPCSNDFGNLGFSATALAIGTGSRAIGRKPLSSRTAPDDWGVDALILSAATDVIVSATAGTVLDAGDIGFTLKTPRKVPPAIIQNDARWRSRLGGPLADWQAAVTKEFAEWRERQDAEVARILV
ncbi:MULTISPECIES: ABC-three component system protein [Mesorhizobium]|nr:MULTISPECIES: ABC-three component system protein [Mesorhizobium]